MLYNNQVFIADNIKEVIPEFLMLLKGVIDCPDLPLNVSRSALQNDGFVKEDLWLYYQEGSRQAVRYVQDWPWELWEILGRYCSISSKYGYIKDEKFAEEDGRLYPV